MQESTFAPRPFAQALAALGALALAATLGPAAADAKGKEQKKPNVLVVMTDDMAASDVELMPNVRKLLVKKGTSYTNAITNFSLCCPSRATFLTGQTVHNHGVFGNFYPYGWYGMEGRGNTLPVWLDDAGYETAHVGKWLNGYGAKDQHGEIPKGFDTWRGLLDVSAYDYHNFVMNKDGKLKTWGDEEFAKKLVEFAEIEVRPDPGGLAGIVAQRDRIFGPPPYTYWGETDPDDYSPDVTGKMTNKLLKKQAKKDDPFFTWWSPAAPHREDVAVTLMGRPGPDPRPPVRYEDEVAGMELPEPPNFNEADVSDKPAEFGEVAKPLTEDQVEILSEDYRGRAGSLMAVDDQVGKMVDTLKETGELKDTMIVFLSDNGWMQGEHRITGDKFLPYEESLRIPLILRGPGVPKGQEIDTQVSNVDLAPTLADLAGAKAERKLDGISLLPGLEKPSRLPDRALGIEAPIPLFEGDVPINQWDQPYSGVRTDRYTYVVWKNTGAEELYDREVDPYQLVNVAAEPAFASVKADMAAKLAQLDNCKGESCNDVAQ